ncbi:MAG TPA: DegT/DnrJ/EryC1/StrS family aminotransferase [Lacipirellulaceae bacterium]|nr:DegT/DnrJ/EryC1/StrS family aminotransferase [Lacipirellulaceae bacterium]
MWPRKQLDIGWTDLAFGLLQVIAARSRSTERAVIGDDWLPPEEAVLSLSVRSGLDLFLAALRLPPGSEVIVSAVTIPDMARIIEHYRLVPVPVNVDGQTLQPVVEHLEQSITPRTRAILVAHLFGTHIDMRPIISIAKLHNLLVLEDCAQAFVGCEYAGHPDSTCALFSFGPIKTATALGGAVLRVRDESLRTRMIELQRNYPFQSRWSYLRRLAKYSVFRLLCKPLNYGLLVRGLNTLGKDYDQALGNAAHSFGANNFFEQIRRQPCPPLLRMLQRRIKAFPQRGMRQLMRRSRRGNRLASSLSAGMVVGAQNPTHTFWVAPVKVANPDEVVRRLRNAGFDATRRSSLIVVPAATEPAGYESALAPWLNEIVFVPNGNDLPDEEWERVISILQEVAVAVPMREKRELAALSAVSIST